MFGTGYPKPVHIFITTYLSFRKFAILPNEHVQSEPYEYKGDQDYRY
jgi:hypothetical protein